MQSLKAMDLVPLEDRSCSFGSYALVLTEQYTPACVSSLMNKAKQFLLPQDKASISLIFIISSNPKEDMDYIGSK